jgi:predicted PurR-regulated permease PerM
LIPGILAGVEKGDLTENSPSRLSCTWLQRPCHGAYLIGVPYALALGAWLGAVPAVLVAFSISPTAVMLTALVFLVIEQVEGNFLTPRIQGQTIKVPSIIVFLGVIAGGSLAGIMGVLFAVPTLAVLRILFDFFHVRLRTELAAD